MIWFKHISGKGGHFLSFLYFLNHSLSELAQPRDGVLLQHLPHDLVPHTAHVQEDSLAAAPSRQDHLLGGDWLRGLVQGVESYVRQRVGAGAGPAPQSSQIFFHFISCWGDCHTREPRSQERHNTTRIWPMRRVCGSIIPRWLLASKVDILSTKTIKIKSENEIKDFHSTLEMAPPVSHQRYPAGGYWGWTQLTSQTPPGSSPPCCSDWSVWRLR